MAGLLKMYGITGKRVNSAGFSLRLPDIQNTIKTGNSEVLESVQKANKADYTIDTEFLNSFMVLAGLDKMGTFEHSEYMTKLQLATEIKSRMEYEFFQDVNGDFIFKPPFYNLDVKGLLPYNIKPNDIISSSFSNDTEGIITCIQVHTAFYELLRDNPFARGEGFHIDINLAKNYGIRWHEISMEYINDKNLARQLALGQMNLINSKTVTGNVTIPGRPEIRLGYPIYIPYRDSYHYVKSISHTFDFAGTFTTTLSLETERRRIYSFKNNAWGDPLTNRVYVFKEGLLPSPPIASTTSNDPPQVYEDTKAHQDIKALLASSNRVVSIPQGRYEIKDAKTAAKETGHNVIDLQFVTDKTVPFTDEKGYRLIGSFPYGRSVNAICIGGEIQTRVLKNNPTAIFPASMIESRSMIPLFFTNQEGSVPNFLTTSGANAINTGVSSPPSNAITLSQATDQVAQPLTSPQLPAVPLSNIAPTNIKAANDQSPASASPKTIDQQTKVWGKGGSISVEVVNPGSNAEVQQQLSKLGNYYKATGKTPPKPLVVR